MDVERVRAWLASARVPEAELHVEALLQYALGLLASRLYRERFDALLRRDYPRLLPPRNAEMFAAVRGVGRALQQALHGSPKAVDATEVICGVGHFAPSALQISGSPDVHARLVAWNRALRAADELFDAGACA